MPRWTEVSGIEENVRSTRRSSRGCACIRVAGARDLENVVVLARDRCVERIRWRKNGR